ncbi:conserved Plasmodium protein, unknown function [Plasmodium vinckei vinckei]|uniref:Uncharacterized protein n=1 Tax=Plasmodium vinckei vinckei TaxID=54757 RepID=A0A449BTA0_PLAVN|nr:conserved Plasmodium protein, unknown function [Plasmodium vinckei vinckei]KEG02324.1 hypothetical protein YYE_03063 [Plasmodium vinckei vinckei]VEV56569.1 conserved Plasmodium protein, unknown function [Plasmodium vinckei vinckei]
MHLINDDSLKKKKSHLNNPESKIKINNNMKLSISTSHSYEENDDHSECLSFSKYSDTLKKYNENEYQADNRLNAKSKESFNDWEIKEKIELDKSLDEQTLNKNDKLQNNTKIEYKDKASNFFDYMERRNKEFEEEKEESDFYSCNLSGENDYSVKEYKHNLEKNGINTKGVLTDDEIEKKDVKKKVETKFEHSQKMEYAKECDEEINIEIELEKKNTQTFEDDYDFPSEYYTIFNNESKLSNLIKINDENKTEGEHKSSEWDLGYTENIKKSREKNINILNSKCKQNCNFIKNEGVHPKNGSIMDKRKILHSMSSKASIPDKDNIEGAQKKIESFYLCDMENNPSHSRCDSEGNLTEESQEKSENETGDEQEIAYIKKGSNNTISNLERDSSENFNSELDSNDIDTLKKSPKNCSYNKEDKINNYRILKCVVKSPIVLNKSYKSTFHNDNKYDVKNRLKEKISNLNEKSRKFSLSNKGTHIKCKYSSYKNKNLNLLPKRVDIYNKNKHCKNIINLKKNNNNIIKPTKVTRHQQDFSVDMINGIKKMDRKINTKRIYSICTNGKNEKIKLPIFKVSPMIQKRNFDFDAMVVKDGHVIPRKKNSVKEAFDKYKLYKEKSKI